MSVLTFDNSIDKNMRQMNIVWIELSRLYYLFSLDNTNFPRYSDVWIKISSCFSENRVAKSISFVCLYAKINNYEIDDTLTKEKSGYNASSITYILPLN